ncbi:uncharacterized protein BDZ99DRAFT_566095 [Mytilinidion resinicola]|uniref:Uncharacterized protein n=1 Tax=Mytilinidion resinicola TaxID=574789 RepID=A0A6A6Z5E8_9PEZI|nr:uncharacterized protein BDZ99DRAFT_566095 [Mytilinidion resinicola]KAF2816250.1 hypothetical protein BDZ99DRAFT_566095 [Mytilinidion resinicola]
MAGFQQHGTLQSAKSGDSISTSAGGERRPRGRAGEWERSRETGLGSRGKCVDSLEGEGLQTAQGSPARNKTGRERRGWRLNPEALSTPATTPATTMRNIERCSNHGTCRPTLTSSEDSCNQRLPLTRVDLPGLASAGHSGYHLVASAHAGPVKTAQRAAAARHEPISKPSG